MILTLENGIIQKYVMRMEVGKMAASGSAGAAKQTSGSTTKSTSRSKNTSSKSNTTARKSPAKKKTSGHTGARSKKQQQIRRDEMKDNIIVLAMIACTIILLLSNFNLAGSIGEKIKWLMFGLIGIIEYIFPVIMLGIVFFLISNREYIEVARIKSAALIVLMLMFSSGWQRITDNPVIKSASIGEFFKYSARNKGGGGFFGGLVCKLLSALGLWGSLVVIIVVSIICIIIITESSFINGMNTVRRKGTRMVHAARQDYDIYRQHSAGRVRKEKQELSEEEYLAMRREKTEERLRKRDRINEEKKLARMDKKHTGVTKDTQLKKKEIVIDPVDIHEITIDEEALNDSYSKDIYDLYENNIDSEYNDSEMFSNDTVADGRASNDTAYDYAASDYMISDGEHTDMYNSSDKTAGMHKDKAMQADEAYNKAAADKDTYSVSPQQDIYELEELPDKSDDDELINRVSEKLGEMAEKTQQEAEYDTQLYEQDSNISENINISDIYDTDSDGNRYDSNTGEIIHEHEAEEIPSASDDLVSDDGGIKRSDSRCFNNGNEGDKGNNDDNAKLSKPYVFPPLHLLNKNINADGTDTMEQKRATANRLQQTLKTFGVDVKITDISCGPSVTRYELQPKMGVKVSKIVSLADDIKLNLAAADIRIEAPIPGKAAVGIEVPNKNPESVMLRDILDTEVFRNHKSNIAFGVGKDIAGKTIVADIQKMPHMLIAGATGSGKSVCINTIIMSILFKAKPEDVKMIMVDPKVVELSVYNGIPHLMLPVVTDCKKAAGALNWAVAEMDRRYKQFESVVAKNIEGYNKKVETMQTPEGQEPLKKMPQLVIIIDELADLMMVAPGDVETAICRLAQLARAAGIHLVIATQRPSVNVITGLIKANVPSRVAFAVSSGVDSRTIIDMNGAEKLLGKGDMLFYPAGYPKPVRVQGAFVSDEEVVRVVDFLKEQVQNEEVYNNSISEEIDKALPDGDKADSPSRENERDPYFAEAGRFFIKNDKGSIGMLQRYYKIGYNRAARLVDQLTFAGVVGPEMGTKPRKVLMTAEEFEEYLKNNN